MKGVADRRSVRITTVVLMALIVTMPLLAGCFGDPFAPGSKPPEGLLPQEQSSQRPAAPASAAPAAAKPVVVFANGNTLGIRKGGKAPTFKLEKAATVTEMSTYHYVDGGLPAAGTLGLKGADGKLYGPWTCTGSDGQGGIKNAFWFAHPNAEVPAGTYTIVDSEPSTWSTNDKAKGLGFSSVSVVYK
jgi:hypothetical protein